MTRKKIMIIDDDFDLVEALRMTLEGAGFDVIDAQSGAQGLEMIKSEKPDLLILDIMMSSQDEGFFVAYTIRKDPDLCDLPIIVLSAVSQETGFAFDKDKDEDFLPVNEFIEKPINPIRLIELVKTNLGL